MVALGTSLTWGDGLKEEATFRYEVAEWLTEMTGRPVQLTTFAHSAAYLGEPPQGVIVAPNPAPTVGAINWNIPSVDDQIACAASQYALSSANLVILDGCINEINAYLIVAPWEKAADLKSDVKKYCGSTMESTLLKIKASFPVATVVVVGYYPLISSQSSVFGLKGSQRLEKHLEKTYKRKYPNFAQPRTSKSRSEQNSDMITNSELFYDQSKQSITDAVIAVGGGGKGRFFFAGLPEVQVGGTLTVDPQFAYGAPQTHQWMLPVRFLWWVFYKDDDYWHRYKLCGEYVAAGLERVECEMNAGFHPNVQGADIYAKSIEAVISPDVIKGWSSNGSNP
jgi:hypothetical protein